jgi:hypothetical protein
MVYARLIVQCGCGRYTHKIIAESMEAYKNYLKGIEGNGTTVVDEFVNSNYGTVVVLPEDFKY